MTHHVVIAGGGVGALEGLLALQHLAADRLEISVITASRHLTYRALSVAEPFGADPAPRYEWERIARDRGVLRDAGGRAAWRHSRPTWRPRTSPNVAGADVAVHSYKPKLQGMLLTGDDPLYLERRPGTPSTSEASSKFLWSPAHKVAGRHLDALGAKTAG